MRLPVNVVGEAPPTNNIEKERSLSPRDLNDEGSGEQAEFWEVSPVGSRGDTLGRELSFPSGGLSLNFYNSPAVGGGGLETGDVVPEEGPHQQDSRGEIGLFNSQPMHAESSDDAALAVEELERFIDDSFRGFIGDQTTHE